MRHYAPHNAQFQTWASAPSDVHRRPSARTPTLSARVSSLLSSLSRSSTAATTNVIIPAPSEPSPSPSSTSTSSSSCAVSPVPLPHDRALWAALSRWLHLSAQSLTVTERHALRLLSPRFSPPPTTTTTTTTTTTYPYCIVCELDVSRPSPPAEHPSTSTSTSSPPLNANSTPSHLSLSTLLFHVVAYMSLWALLLCFHLISLIRRFRRSLYARSRLHARVRALTERLASPGITYSEWHQCATLLDMLHGNHFWTTSIHNENHHHHPHSHTIHHTHPSTTCTSCEIRNLCSDCHAFFNSPDQLVSRRARNDDLATHVHSQYDTHMLTAKLAELAVLYRQGDVRALAFALRVALVRNFAGIYHPDIHAHCRTHTHSVIQDSIHVVSFLLAYIAQSHHTYSSLPAAQHNNNEDDVHVPHVRIDDPRTLSVDDKLTYLNEARHAHGRTALMLSGGAVMGLHHLGVVKALVDQQLLPRVVCGTSAGAIVAGIVGTLTECELKQMLCKSNHPNTKSNHTTNSFTTSTSTTTSPPQPAYQFLNPLTATEYKFDFFQEPVSLRGRLSSFLAHGYLEDISGLQRTLRANFGDLTFQEAYEKTGIILNVTVCPTRRSSDPSLLLNYLTAGCVLIWSAVSASCALPLMFKPVELVAKSANGRFVPYHPGGSRWIDGSVSSDVPLARIGELFNANHFIVSQTNPHVIPRSLPILNSAPATLIKTELQFRYWQATQIGLVPRFVAAIFPHFMQPYAGDVTIMPDVRVADLSVLMSNPDKTLIADFLDRGQAATFPFVNIIRLHCAVERVLDMCVEAVATTVKHPATTHTHHIHRQIAPAPATANIHVPDNQHNNFNHNNNSAAAAVPKEGHATPTGRPTAHTSRQGSNSTSRLGLFGRVPSWLWLDTRSMIPSRHAVSAVTNRLKAAAASSDPSPSHSHSHSPTDVVKPLQSTITPSSSSTTPSSSSPSSLTRDLTVEQVDFVTYADEQESVSMLRNMCASFNMTRTTVDKRATNENDVTVEEAPTHSKRTGNDVVGQSRGTDRISLVVTDTFDNVHEEGHSNSNGAIINEQNGQSGYGVEEKNDDSKVHEPSEDSWDSGEEERVLC